MAQEGRAGGNWLTYRDLAEELPGYAAIWDLLISNFCLSASIPFDGSWGYQPTGLFAPDQSLRHPSHFVHLSTSVTSGSGSCSIGCPAISRDDPHDRAVSMAPRSMNTTIPCRAVTSIGVPSFTTMAGPKSRASSGQAPFWLERYGVDGLRVEAAASMLYLDYSRPVGHWVPNKLGGRENIEAIAFLRRTNTEVFKQSPARRPPLRSRRTGRWFRGRSTGARLRVQVGTWGGCTTRSITYQGPDLPPSPPRQHFIRVALRLLGKFHLAPVTLTRSCTKVLHLGRTAGHDLAALRQPARLLRLHVRPPGKKLILGGQEFAQDSEWNHDVSLPWHLID